MTRKKTMLSKNNICLLLAVMTLTGCNNGSIEINDPIENTETTDSAAIPTASIVSEVEEISDVEEETMPKEINVKDHTYFKEKISADDVVEYHEIELPEFEGYKTGFRTIINRDTILIYLKPADVPNANTSEIGLYNFQTKEYTSIISDEAAKYASRTNDEKYIVFTNYSADMSYEWLYIYNIDNNEMKQVYSYALSKEGTIYSPHGNNILIIDNLIYFDDYYESASGEVDVKLLCYNITTDTVELVKDNAQNPLFYKDDLIFITKDEDGNYNTISSKDESVSIKLDGEVFGPNNLKANKYSIYTTMYSNFRDSNSQMNSKFVLKDLVTNEPIIASTDPICDMSLTDHYLCWNDYTGLVYTHPAYYDLNLKKLVSFDSIDDCDYFFYPYDDVGILITRTEVNYKICDKYYFFSPK